MEARAARLLALVLRDVATCAEIELRVQHDYRPPAALGLPSDEDMPHGDMLMVWTPDGSGTGIWIDGALADHELLVEICDKVQEAVTDWRWHAGLSTAWPPCPWHPSSHPLGVGLRGTQVVWSCPSDQQVACQIGQLTC